MADLSLVCIVLIIGLELNVMKESFTTRESTYIELIFRKAIVQFACAKTARKLPNTAKKNLQICEL